MSQPTDGHIMVPGPQLPASWSLCRRVNRKVRLGIFTARRYASAVYAVVMWTSVRLSVCHKPAMYQKD